MSDRLSHEKVWAVLDLFDYACARMGTLDKLLEGSEWEEEPLPRERVQDIVRDVRRVFSQMEGALEHRSDWEVEDE